MGSVNIKFINDLIAQLLTAAEGGAKLNFNDPNAVGQYILAIIGLGAELIPYIGSAVAALCNLLGTLLFSSNSTQDIWDSLRERIERLIDAKIEVYQLRILKQKIVGFQDNLAVYSQYLQNYEDANTPDEKMKAADTLKSTHISCLSVVLAGVPEFQVDVYAVPSLPLFSLVATMHLTLLADGIKRGQEWGYSKKNIDSMKAQFKAKTSPSSGSAPDYYKSLEDVLLPGSMLKEAISKGLKAGVPAEVLDTWKEAYATLYEPGSDPENGDERPDYVTYAKKIYAQGRKDLQFDEGSNYQGYAVASNYQVCSGYDSNMVLSVLNYAELWPFMAGDKWTETAIRNVDREIFYGPYDRWADGASWTLSSPPPVTDRCDPITSIIVRAADDIDGVDVKHGSSWDGFQGNSSGGVAKQLNMSPDEYVTSVTVTYGFKLGKLVFTTNHDSELRNGNARHASWEYNVAVPGYELTSVNITRWVGDSPTGCEGVILGFRPLLTDTTRSQS